MMMTKSEKTNRKAHTYLQFVALNEMESPTHGDAIQEGCCFLFDDFSKYAELQTGLKKNMACKIILTFQFKNLVFAHSRTACACFLGRA